MIEEIYQPRFDDFQGRPIITWSHKNSLRVADNLYAQYTRWKTNKSPKHSPPQAFWQSNGPAICRALEYLGASGLFLDWCADDKVSYRWICKKPTANFGIDLNWYCVLDVKAEGGRISTENRAGTETRVTVTLPTDEDVSFVFRPDTMREWLPELKTK